ncbi:hypothetical protein AVEN_24523-1 [Araneus ventricosus]|uniref:Uncharacterized protein n=1 Tax=Araneus ventricosus TaxID=182803 RepID=A0A4Y2KUP9_ARAVE|nr:hypothetical protein AVEN_24523-1 [Araneus ventricosus]
MVSYILPASDALLAGAERWTLKSRQNENCRWKEIETIPDALEISSPEKLPFIAQQKDESTKLPSPVAPNDSDQDSSEDVASSIKIVPHVVTRAGQRVKIDNRLDL